MGLDLYAGTLTRYYAKSWKTVTQQWAEANGLQFQTMRPNGDTDTGETLPLSVILEDMQSWSNKMANALACQEPLIPWEENNEKDYFTDKPDWIAYGTLLLYGACMKYGIPLPKQVKKNWNYQEDPIVKRALEDTNFNWSLFSFAEWWLPFEDRFTFQCPTPNGVTVMMGTTGTLLAELRKINTSGWNANEETIAKWSKTEGYPTDAEFVNGTYRKIAENDSYDTESLAKFALSIFYQAALFSEKNRVPILMDY